MSALDYISISGFKSIKNIELNLKSLNVLIGPNGAGKTNFISFFKLFNKMVEGQFQFYVSQAGGANAFLHYGKKTTERISVKLKFGHNGYDCVWEPTLDDTLIFVSERGYNDPIPIKSGPIEQTILRGHKESIMLDKNLYYENEFATLGIIKSWKVYHFHDTSETAGVKGKCQINDNICLAPDARNLAAFLYRLKETSNPHYLIIRDTVRQVVPFFDDFILRPTPANENFIQLEWREKNSDYPFLAYQMSDGTLRFICLATLLLQPELPTTILIDEPELGLHPHAITILAALIQGAATKTQVIVSTQSVPFINQFQAEDLLIVERKEQETTIEWIDTNKMSSWLEDYPLGELWEKNVLGGSP